MKLLSQWSAWWWRPRRLGRGLAVVLGAVACTPAEKPDAGRVASDEVPPSRREPESPARGEVEGQAKANAQPDPDDSVQAPRRRRMVAEQLRARDITDPRVLETMERVPRHAFVPADLRSRAYDDGPLPIGSEQTISQPYIVALMTQCAAPRPEARALDIGTGSGYQAAVLAGLVREVFSIEIVPTLADSARDRLQALGYRNVTVRTGDGYRGWPEKAPFDLIILAAAAPDVPAPLIEQLAPGGRLVLPVDVRFGGQDLIVITKRPDGSIERRQVAPVAFVPMTGDARKPRHQPPTND